MTHTIYHAQSSVKVFGGQVADYLPLHDWLDQTKEHYAFFTHRALRHNTESIEVANQLFGTEITNADGVSVLTKSVFEQHLLEDCGGRLPTLDDWFRGMSKPDWLESGITVGDHANASAQRWGGDASDYLPLHEWFFAPIIQYGKACYVALTTHSEGIFELQNRFGHYITNKDGKIVPVRYIGEYHAKRQCQGSIPTIKDWLVNIKAQSWMSHGIPTFLKQ